MIAAKELAEAQTKLQIVEHQLETARVEVEKPFAQEMELAEKLERLSALNALINMDEKTSVNRHKCITIVSCLDYDNERHTLRLC